MDFTLAELFLQHVMGAVVFGEQDQPGGVLIQAVDNAGPLLAANTFHFWGMRQGSMDQCSVTMPGCRMDNHPGRFVNHHQILIFKDNIQGDRFGLQTAGLLWGNADDDRGRVV